MTSRYFLAGLVAGSVLSCAVFAALQWVAS
jgi:hypothetical protein